MRLNLFTSLFSYTLCFLNTFRICRALEITPIIKSYSRLWQFLAEMFYRSEIWSLNILLWKLLVAGGFLISLFLISLEWYWLLLELKKSWGSFCEEILMGRLGELAISSNISILESGILSTFLIIKLINKIKNFAFLSICRNNFVVPQSQLHQFPQTSSKKNHHLHQQSFCKLKYSSSTFWQKIFSRWKSHFYINLFKKN